MKGTWVVLKRELRSFFVSPLAYIVMTAWLLWTGLTFVFLAEHYASNAIASGLASPLTSFFEGNALFFIPLLLFVPVLTMRLLAGETQSGTLETLMTAPVSETAIVFGKYGAAMAFWIALWAPTLIYALIMRQYGDVDWGAIGASYLGVLGLGLYFMAIGLLVSAVAPTQIIAAVLAFLFLGMLLIVGIGEFVLDGWLREACSYVSMWGHMRRFSKGVVDTRYVVFDLSVASFALAVAIGALKARRFS